MELKDKEILQLLQQNSRHSNKDIADMLELSETDVEEKIQHMVYQGIIRQFTAIVNDNSMEGYPIKALVELSISPEKDTGYDSIAKRIFEYSEVTSHYLVSGNYDFLLVVEGRDHKEIAHFVFDKLATVENVKSTTTHFIFKSYKEQGVLMEDVEASSRLAIMP